MIPIGEGVPGDPAPGGTGGPPKNAGAKLDRVLTPANAHDVRCGIYDPHAHRGSIFAGVSYDNAG